MCVCVCVCVYVCVCVCVCVCECVCARVCFGTCSNYSLYEYLFTQKKHSKTIFYDEHVLFMKEPRTSL